MTAEQSPGPRRRWWAPLAVAVVVAVIAHLVVVLAAPRVVMGVAERRIAESAGGRNTWLHTPRVTPRNQQVVRSSPDLAYSACVWDLSDGPVRVSAPGWDGYYSLSIYDDRTDVVFVDGDPHPEVTVLLATTDQEDQARRAAGSDVEVVVVPAPDGVALLRYLAPTDDAFADADRVRSSAVCAPA
ncbi:putative membrane protein [Mumia flava]|uniref:Putative membrane protein n=1 Tax=Mumia flava TaxID=1348852 RepID=A0A0B2B892_9ACTN|nr:DUF1254 domain-containing protein [Mumia flava]PJJ55893.1 putative membrane protein [Mumia flava]